MLVQLCIAVSNLTIFNSENNFSRNTEEFLNKLNKIKNSKKGKDYY